jgi:endothelin-converting enzyme/putative endopeptidase
MSIIWTRRLNLLTTFPICKRTWLDNEIPSDRTRWGSFDELRQKRRRCSGNIERGSNKSKYKSDTDQGKAINLYKTILDTIGRNKLGITPLKPYLKKIDAVKTQKDLQALLVKWNP